LTLTKDVQIKPYNKTDLLTRILLNCGLEIALKFENKYRNFAKHRNVSRQAKTQKRQRNMSNKIALGIAVLTVILNGLIGHFFAPNGILLTPIVLTITTILVCFGTKNINSILISALTYLFVALNDILIKLYSSGSHDYQGHGWIHLLLFIGLVPTFGILIATVFKRKEESVINKVIAISLFIGLIILHLHFFSNLGLGRYY